MTANSITVLCDDVHEMSVVRCAARDAKSSGGKGRGGEDASPDSSDSKHPPGFDDAALAEAIRTGAANATEYEPRAGDENLGTYLVPYVIPASSHLTSAGVWSTTENLRPLGQTPTPTDYYARAAKLAENFNYRYEWPPHAQTTIALAAPPHVPRNVRRVYAPDLFATEFCTPENIYNYKGTGAEWEATGGVVYQQDDLVNATTGVVDKNAEWQYFKTIRSSNSLRGGLIPIEWDPPLYAGLSPIQGYVVQVSLGGSRGNEIFVFANTSGISYFLEKNRGDKGVVTKLRTCVHSLADDEFGNVVGGGKLYAVRVAAFNEANERGIPEIEADPLVAENAGAPPPLGAERDSGIASWKNTMWPNSFKNPETLVWSDPNYFLSRSETSKPPAPTDLQIIKRTNTSVVVVFDVPSAAMDETSAYSALTAYGLETGALSLNDSLDPNATNTTPDPNVLPQQPFSYFFHKTGPDTEDALLKYDYQVPGLQYFNNVTATITVPEAVAFLPVNDTNDTTVCTVYLNATGSSIDGELVFNDTLGYDVCLYNLTNTTAEEGFALLGAPDALYNLSNATTEDGGVTNLTSFDAPTPFRPLCDWYSRCFFNLYDDTDLSPIRFHTLAWSGSSRLAVLEGLSPGQKYNISVSFSTDAGESDLAVLEFPVGFAPVMPEEVLRSVCSNCSTIDVDVLTNGTSSVPANTKISMNVSWADFVEHDPRFAEYFPILLYEVELTSYYDTTIVSSDTALNSTTDALAVSILDENPEFPEAELTALSTKFINQTFTTEIFTVDTATPYIVFSLDLDRTYSVRVRSSNVNGWGPWTELRDFMVALPPSAPRNIDIRYTSDTGVDLTWASPVFAGANTHVQITGYRLYGVDEDLGVVDTVQPWLVAEGAHPLTNFRLRGLGPGKFRKFELRSVNSARQESNPGAFFEVNVGLPPRKMAEVQFVNLSDSTLRVSWTAPVSVLPITKYQLQLDPAPIYAYLLVEDVQYGNTTVENKTVTTNYTHYRDGGSSLMNGTVSAESGAILYTGTDTAYTLSGLLQETEYRLRVRAKNVNGHSPWSEGRQLLLSNSSELYLPPPTVTVLGATETSVSIEWAAASANDRVIEYELSCESRKDSRLVDRIRVRKMGAPRFQFTNLVTGDLYRFSVVACNVNGCGVANSVDRLAAMRPQAPLAPYRVFLETADERVKTLCPQVRSAEAQWHLDAAQADLFCTHAVYDNVTTAQNVTDENGTTEEIATTSLVQVNERHLLNTTVVLGWDLQTDKDSFNGGMVIEAYNVFVSDKSEGEGGIYSLLTTVNLPYLGGTTSHSGGIYAFQACSNDDLLATLEQFTSTPVDYADEINVPSSASNATTSLASQLGRYYRVSARNAVGEGPLSAEALVFCGPVHPRPAAVPEQHVELVQPKSDVKVKLPWTFVPHNASSVEDKYFPIPTKLEVVLYIQQNTPSMGDRDEFLMRPHYDANIAQTEQYHRREVEKYLYKSREHMPFLHTDFRSGRTKLTSSIEPRVGISHYSWKAPFYYPNFATSPYQEVVSLYGAWTRKARELDEMSGTKAGFGFHPYANLTATDNALLEHTFTHLKEAHWYALQYRVTSATGVSPWSPLTHVYVSKLPPKPRRPYGLLASLEKSRISWGYDDSDENYLRTANLIYYNVYISESANIKDAVSFGPIAGTTYEHDCVLYMKSQTQLHYWVAGVNGAGEGPASDPLRWSCSPIPDQPIAPTLYYYLGKTGYAWDLAEPNRTDYITFNWTHGNAFGADIVGTKILCHGNEDMRNKTFISKDGHRTVRADGMGDGQQQRVFFVEGGVTVANITTLNPTQRYDCSVATVSDVGESILSPSVAVRMSGKPSAPPFAPKYVSSTADQIVIEYDPWPHGIGLIITSQKSHNFSQTFRNGTSHVSPQCLIHRRNAFYHAQTCTTIDER